MPNAIARTEFSGASRLRYSWERSPRAADVVRSQHRRRDRSTFGVSLVGPTVVEKVFPYNADAEHRKLRSIASSLRPTRFSVPKSWVDPEQPNTLYMGRVAAHVTLQDLLASGADVASEVASCADALTYIHGLREEAAGDGSGRVRLHGDFSPQNVLVCEGSMWMVDSSPNHYSTFETDAWGDPLVDVCTFTLKLVWPFRWSALVSFPERRQLRRLFLAEYTKALDASVSSWRILRMELRLFVSYVVHRQLLRSHERG